MKELKGIKKIFANQVQFQRKLNDLDILPRDIPELFANSLLLMVEEIGEVLKEDKRWKSNFRSGKYDEENKIEELTDIFIVMMNLLIFSGLSIKEFMKEVEKKQVVNFERMLKALNEGDI